MKKLTSFFFLFMLCSFVQAQVFDSLRIPANIGLSNAELVFKNDLCKSSNGDLWIGLMTKGVLKFSNGQWVLYTVANTSGSLPANRVARIKEGTSGTIWLAGDSSITSYINGTWNTWWLSSSNPGLRITDFEISTVEIYAATSQGLYVCNRNTGNWTIYNSGNSTLPADSLNAVSLDGGGKLWVAGVGGLSHFNNGQWTNYTTQNSSLRTNRILDVCVQNQDTLFTTEPGGIYFFNGGNFASLDSISFGTLSSDFCSQPYGKLTWNYRPSRSYSRMAKDGSGTVYVLRSESIGAGFAKPDLMKIVSRTAIFRSSNMISSATPHPAYHAVITALAGDTLYFAPEYSHNGSVVFKQSVSKDFENCIASYSQYAGAYNIPMLLPASQVVTSKATLNANLVRASITNQGQMHAGPASTGGGYAVPFTSNNNTVYASSLWFGSVDPNGQLRVAAQTFMANGQNDFWPGPLYDSLPGVKRALLWDSLWVINRTELDEFRYQFLKGNVTNGTYIIPDFFYRWPTMMNAGVSPHSLAPYVDFNGDGMYNPMDGDYPEMKGDQMIWNVYNDTYGTKTSTGSVYTGLEIQQSSYAYTCSKLAGNNPALAYTTFYHYDVYNYFTDTLNLSRIGLWSDIDIGDLNDDFVGCNVDLNAFFGYNQNFMPDYFYGACPPMQSVVILKTPLVDGPDNIDNDHNGFIDEQDEMLGMSKFMYYHNINGSGDGNPAVADDYFDYLNAFWLDGIQATFGGDARGLGNGATSTPANYVFPGTTHPGISTDWTMSIAGNPTDDLRGIGAAGPFTFAPGAHVSFEVAFITGPNDIARNDSVIRSVIEFYKNGMADTVGGIMPSIQGQVNVQPGGSSTYNVPMAMPPNAVMAWTVKGGILISGQGTNSITVVWGPMGYGSVQVELLVSGTSCKEQKLMQVQIGNVSLDDLSKSAIVLYPNPAADRIKIKGDLQRFNEIAIYSLEGKLCLKQKVEDAVSIGFLNEGMYFMELTGDNQEKLQRKFVVERH